MGNFMLVVQISDLAETKTNKYCQNPYDGCHKAKGHIPLLLKSSRLEVQGFHLTISIWLAYIYARALHKKCRTSETWWGAILNSYQEPNHWKTLTGFQCGLPGQHEQELSTMTAELQKTLRVAQNNRGMKQKRKPSVYRDKSGKTMNTCWEYFCTITKGWKFECSSRRGAFLCPAVCQLAVLAAALVTSIPLIHCMYKYTSKHTSLITLKVFEGFQPENELKSIQEKRICITMHLTYRASSLWALTPAASE